MIYVLSGFLFVVFKKLKAANQAELAANAATDAAMERIRTLEETNGELCDLISQTSDRAAKLSESNDSLVLEKNSLVQRMTDIRNQIQSNTDLELATVDQIVEELKNRKARFLLLRPSINDGVNAVASLVSKQDAVGVLKLALSGLESQEDWKEDQNDDEWNT